MSVYVAKYVTGAWLIWNAQQVQQHVGMCQDKGKKRTEGRKDVRRTWALFCSECVEVPLVGLLVRVTNQTGLITRSFKVFGPCTEDLLIILEQRGSPCVLPIFSFALLIRIRHGALCFLQRHFLCSDLFPLCRTISPDFFVVVVIVVVRIKILHL